MDYSEKWGVDVDEAVNLALMDLKLTREEVNVIVLEEPSKGFFGIGSKLAKVRVEKKKEEKKSEENLKKQDETKNDKQDSAPKKEKKNKSKETRKNRPKHEEEKFDEIGKIDDGTLTPVEDHQALDFLKDVIDKMGLKINFSAKVGEDLIYIEAEGPDTGTLIGKRGQTLDAIQYLTSLAINKDTKNYVKVVIDAENYREKRKKTLEQLANRLATKVEKTKRYVRLEPMNPYERKVIHAALQKKPNITTRSEGEEPYRRIIIELKK